MSRKVTVVACLFSFVAGVLAMFAVFRFQHISSAWFPLAKASSPLGFSTEVALKSDIALPDVKEISGTAKFLPDTDLPNSQKVGYLVHVVVSPLDLKKVPEKYLKDRPSEVEGVKTVRPPIEQVYYEVQLTFTLKDKDGFTLAEVVSPSETVTSGKDNQLQNFGMKSVANDLAARTKVIYLQLYFKKCFTCESE